MNSINPQLLASLFLTGLVLAGYALAIRDWSRATSSELADAHRPGLLLAATALALVGLLAGLQGIAYGWAKIPDYLGGGGYLLLLQALGLTVLVQAGALWAWRTGGQPFGPARPWGRLTLELVLALALMLAWTAVLARLWPHHVLPTGEPLLDSQRAPATLGWPFALALLTLTPILEECLFRHYLLYRIAAHLKSGRMRATRANAVDSSREQGASAGARFSFTSLLAIACTSLLWAAAHHGLLDPYALKLTQTFGLGLILGVVALRHGLFPAIALHWAFNLLLIPLLALLER